MLQRQPVAARRATEAKDDLEAAEQREPEARMTTTRPRDPVQLGKLIVEIATGQVEDREDDGKNAAG